MRSTWTDERLDDLSLRMSEGFQKVDADLRDIRGDLNSFKVEANARFDSLQRTLIQCGWGLATSIVCLIIAFVLTAH